MLDTYRRRVKGVQAKKESEGTYIDDEKGHLWKKLIAEDSLMGNNPEKALLHAEEMNIYKKEKEVLTKEEFLVEEIVTDGNL